MLFLLLFGLGVCASAAGGPAQQPAVGAKRAQSVQQPDDLCLFPASGRSGAFRSIHTDRATGGGLTPRPAAGRYHRLRWNGRDAAGLPVASGLYLYRLMTDEVALTRKLMLLR